jgi:20S proteasome alpha/beta subunit
VSSLEYDFINFDFPCVENERRQKIYPCLIDQQVLTVIIGAKCLDGITLIADRKLTRRNGEVCFSNKIIGDIRHFLIGYTGDAEMFDIFRRYTAGDVMIERDTETCYTLENLLLKVSDSIKRFNELRCTPFKVLMANHKWDASVLYHIDVDGTWKEIGDYKAIGSGATIADRFCAGLDYNNIKIKDFVRRAYLAIEFMDQYCPALGVGVEPGGVPNIKYLYYDQESDKEAAKDVPQDIKEYKEYTNNKLEKIMQSLESIIKD